MDADMMANCRKAMQGMDADMMAAASDVAPQPGPEGMAPPADAGGMGDMDALGAAFGAQALTMAGPDQWELISRIRR